MNEFEHKDFSTKKMNEKRPLYNPVPKSTHHGALHCTFSVTKAFHKAMCMFVISQLNLHCNKQSLKLETKHSWNGK